MRPGVRLHDLVTVSLNGAGTIDHAIEDPGSQICSTGMSVSMPRAAR